MKHTIKLLTLTSMLFMLNSCWFEPRELTRKDQLSVKYSYGYKQFYVPDYKALADTLSVCIYHSKTDTAYRALNYEINRGVCDKPQVIIDSDTMTMWTLPLFSFLQTDYIYSGTVDNIAGGEYITSVILPQILGDSISLFANGVKLLTWRKNDPSGDRNIYNQENWNNDFYHQEDRGNDYYRKFMGKEISYYYGYYILSDWIDSLLMVAIPE